MANPILEFDPTSEATGSPLTITTGNYGLIALSSPAPPPKAQWASSVDTEGSVLASSGHENRSVTIGLRVTGSSALATLSGKIAKLHREGGTLKHTGSAATVVVADILASESYEPAYDFTRIVGGVTEVQFTLPAKSYLRGAEADLGDNVETTLPALVFTEATVAGEVDALGRLVVDEDQAVDQWWLTWGVQSRRYDAATSAALFYEAEGRTVLGGATAVAGPAGASGAGSNVVRQGTLTGTYQAMLSTQATGGGAHLSHVGTFHIWAKVQMPTTNTGAVSVALQWAEGDFRRSTTNAATNFSANHTREGAWVLVDLGLVTLRPVTQGVQRWEGRILAKSTVAGDDIDVDFFFLVPVDEGSGIARGVQFYDAPTTFSARDEFDQTAGALAGKVLPVGGTWAGAGDADDFTVEATGHTAQRTAVSDAGGSGPVQGRVALAGTTTYTNIHVEVTGTYTATGAVPQIGVLARYTDANNWLSTFLISNNITIAKSVAGTTVVLASFTQPGLYPQGVQKRHAIRVDDQGRVFVWLWTEGGLPGEPILAAQHVDLATGGTLATGRIGFWDYHGSAAAATRNYDNFAAAVPVKDAAMFASQSLELRHDRVTREDSGGTIWTNMSDYSGDYLRVPASGAEARTTRMIVKASRNDPEWGTDPGIDDISARLFITPRFLTLPD